MADILPEEGCKRCGLLHQALREATGGHRHGASPCNYSVWDDLPSGMREIEAGLSKDEAIGFARGLEHVGATYNGSTYKPVVRCGAFVCWPEDRYAEIIEEEAGRG